MRKHTCSNCHWQDHNHCFFNPPTVQLLMAQGLQGVQPQPVAFRAPVRPDEFCSNHRPVQYGDIVDV